LIGQTISHYRILEKLGEGGIGVVYKAEDTRLERHVALKFLPAHLLGNEDVSKRFEREARSGAALDHPNVCHVYEIDEADGHTFISMSLIEGESLDKKIAKGPLKLDAALDIARQVTGQQPTSREGNFHHPRHLMLNLLSLDRLIGRRGEPSGLFDS
jgi:serine/threonine protein kinase